jgi:hypothetical protein
MIGQILLALGAIALIGAVVFIGPFPNPGWHEPAVWAVSGSWAAIGLICVGLGTILILYQPEETVIHEERYR